MKPKFKTLGKVDIDQETGAITKREPLPVRPESAGWVSGDEPFVPLLERLTPKQRKKFDKGMKRLRRRFGKRFAKSQRKKPNRGNSGKLSTSANIKEV